MAKQPDTLPGVSYVMPVLNEVEHIEAAVNSLIDQDYEGPFEVILALGPSVDGTNDVIAEMARVDPRIRSIPNELGSTPGGLNVAIRASSNPIVVRVDAHSVLPRNYTRIAVQTLLETGADNVGGIMKAEGTTPFQKAVAHAYGSPEGLGGTQHHVGGKAGPAETAYLGVFQRHRLVEVGLFDEGIKRGQDWELNRRLRQTGGTVWFTPELVVVYRPRSSLSKLIRQFVATGIWRGELVRRLGGRNPLRFFAPPVLVANVVVAIVFIPLHATGVFHGWWGWVLALAYVPPVLYLGLLAAAAFRRGGDLVDWLRFALATATMHLSWGVGFIVGVIRGARDAVDTSRTES